MKQRSYTAQYRVDAVQLAEEIGPSAAARQLKMSVDTLYTWISRKKHGELPLSDMPPEAKESLDLAQQVKQLKQENRVLASEIAQIKRENQILEDAATFFAARRKK